MTFKERNVYQGFIAKLLGFDDPDDWFVVGQAFADLEQEHNRCPKPFEIVQRVMEMKGK